MISVRKLCLQCVFVCIVISTFSTNVLASEKKGVGLTDLNSPEKINALNVSWYYTWKTEPINGVVGSEFVPMLFGRDKLDKQIQTIRSRGKAPVLLAFNEPNRKKNAISVEQVIRRWPEISELADSISGPGTANGNVSESWFKKFFRMSKTKNLKFDFMAVHIYMSPDAKKFLERLDALHDKYQMPIWITEFAARDLDAAQWKCKVDCNNRYSEEEVLNFMKIVLPELEKREYIVRYAWFGAGKRSHQREQVRTSRLFEKDGSLTLLGKYYADFEYKQNSQ